ncbi:MAG: hypothetical protein MHM6MM_004231 [Cercozoa sp. M6MM]
MLVSLFLGLLLGANAAWSSLRPNVFVGMRDSSDVSPIFGLAWSSLDDPEQRVRHTCQRSDSDVVFGWLRHNGEDFGEHAVIDKTLGLEFLHSFVSYGDAWDLKLHVRSLEPKAKSVALNWYFASPEPSNLEFVDNSMRIEHNDMAFRLSVNDTSDEASDPSARTCVKYISEKNDDIVLRKRCLSRKNAAIAVANDDWSESYFDVEKHLERNFRRQQKQQKIFHNLQRVLNSQIPQMTKNREKFQQLRQKHQILPPFVLSETTASKVKTQMLISQNAFTTPFTLHFRFHAEGQESLQTPSFDDKRAEFDAKFSKIFGANTPFAHHTLSNLLGGKGRFFGDYLVHTPVTPDANEFKVQTLGPASLISMVPSRRLFPRGFLWDEGFHQLLVQKWSPEQSAEVLSSWFALTDEDGWIPREQILGAEARSLVPKRFIPQSRYVANPPTLHLALLRLLQQRNVDIGMEPSAVEALLSNAARNARWYLRTQRCRHGLACWRPDHVKGAFGSFASGLDDYPRAEQDDTAAVDAKYDSERGHLDLQCWLIAMCDAMVQLGEHAEQFLSSDTGTQCTLEEAPFDVEFFRQQGSELRRGLFEHFYFAEKHAFFDTFRGDPRVTYGYVTLMPLLLGILSPDSTHFAETLRTLRDEEIGIWSDFGLRSLGTSDEDFATGDNYWRGKIWLNMNFLALRALHQYDTAETRRIYEELKHNVVSNVRRQFERSQHAQALATLGNIYENYDPLDGSGRGTHPFTGWSSLVLAIMADLY